MKNVDIISKVVARKGEAMASPSKGAAPSVDLSGYLLKEIWDRIFEIRSTENGEEYIFCKTSLAAQGGLTMYVDGGLLNLPSIYDGLPIDGKTLFWEEVIADDGTKSKILKSKGGGGGSIEYPLSWSGFSSGSYDGTESKTIYIPSKVSELTNDSNYAKTSDLSKYLPLTGGTLTGDLTLCPSNANYGSTLTFGDAGYAYIAEDEDDHLSIYARTGIKMSNGSDYAVEVDGRLRVQGIFTAKGTYAFMPKGDNGYGLYFKGCGLMVHSDYNYYESLGEYSIGEGCFVFASTPMVSGVNYLADRSWTESRYLLKSGGTITGNLTVNGTFNAKGTKAYMPTGSDGRGFAFAGQYMYVHWDYSSWERIFHLDGNNCGIFAKLPQVTSLGYLADRAWVGQNYLSLSGGSLSGVLSVNGSSADIITLKRTNTGGGAFVSYKGMNQTNLGWAAGVSRGHEFVWIYYTNGSLVDAPIHMTLDKSANLLVKGLLTFQGTSDKRLKKNIRTFGASEELMKLGGVYQFEYIEEEIKRNEKYKGTHFGLIYQNVKESSLSKMCIEREDGFGALNYLDTSFISLLAAVGMEHETRLQRLERENRELRMEVEQLKNK